MSRMAFFFFCPLDPRAHPRNAHNADPNNRTHTTAASFASSSSGRGDTDLRTGSSVSAVIAAWPQPVAGPRRAPPRGRREHGPRLLADAAALHHKNAPEADQHDADQRHDEHQVAERGPSRCSRRAGRRRARVRLDVRVVGRLEGHPGAVGERHGLRARYELRTRRRVDGVEAG